MTKPNTIIIQFWEAGCDPHNPTVEVEATYRQTHKSYHEYGAVTATGVFEVHVPLVEGE